MKQYGLPKSCLLRTTGEFNQVYRNGQRLSGKGYTLIFTPNLLPRNRLGISVQKKIGSAVLRNRIKRIIREAFRCHRDIFPAASDIVIAVRPGFSLANPSAIQGAVHDLINGQTC